MKYNGTGSRSRANRIKDINKRGRNRKAVETERTFLRGPGQSIESREFALHHPFTKTELRQARKHLALTYREAVTYLWSVGQ